MIFSAFGKILVLVNVFFVYSNCNLKSIEKLIFSAFGKILVLVNTFFYSNSPWKSIEKLIFQLLARFFVCGECFFSIQTLSLKVLKICFFNFWQDFGFGECFLHDVIAEFVLPKKYLPELENIFYFLKYSMYVVFSQFLKCCEDSEILNSIFYVCGLRCYWFFNESVCFFASSIL